MQPSPDDPKTRPATILGAFAVVALIMLALFELLSSELLLYRYRRDGKISDGSLSSAVALAIKAGSKLGLVHEPATVALECEPAPCFKADPVYGWLPIPGEQTEIFKRLKGGTWERFPVKTTINHDLSRWTGADADPNKPTIYILGDSFVFGNGVHDEQTFAYHLQMARPHYNVRLFAVGGYSLVHSYLRIAELKDRITERDIIVIGYGDYYDVRNVNAPSRLRAIEAWFRRHNQPHDGAKNPQASLVDEQITVTLGEQDCSKLKDYCKQPDPSETEMAAISTALIREIAKAPAKSHLLYFEGRRDNPVLSNSGIEVISALPQDFDYFMRDDVEGFDPHPGPYWHYAISRKLIDRIR